MEAFSILTVGVSAYCFPLTSPETKSYSELLTVLLFSNITKLNIHYA